MAKITKAQYDEIIDAYATNDQLFVEKLEEYTGITRKPYTAYNYYTDGGDYAGDSEINTIDDILRMAYVEVL
ncbi:MAG: hypothetical protein IKT52_13835 [Oscillospiraceae bacterium]|nr:hypothetical protein [Oscillospiraceae bacterium]